MLRKLTAIILILGYFLSLPFRITYQVIKSIYTEIKSTVSLAQYKSILKVNDSLNLLNDMRIEKNNITPERQQILNLEVEKDNIEIDNILETRFK